MDDRNYKASRLVALDAVDYRATSPENQYSTVNIERDLRKCLVALKPAGDDTERLRPFATGNWGCGVFQGDVVLKGIIQWAAACATGRRLLYYPHGERRANDLRSITTDLIETYGDGLNVGHVVDGLAQLHEFYDKNTFGIDDAIRDSIDDVFEGETHHRDDDHDRVPSHHGDDNDPIITPVPGYDDGDYDVPSSHRVPQPIFDEYDDDEPPLYPAQQDGTEEHKSSTSNIVTVSPIDGSPKSVGFVDVDSNSEEARQTTD